MNMFQTKYLIFFVVQVVEMLKTYLEKTGQDDEAELMKSFSERLTLKCFSFVGALVLIQPTVRDFFPFGQEGVNLLLEIFHVDCSSYTVWLNKYDNLPDRSSSVTTLT
jgi:hypothetical protein